MCQGVQCQAMQRSDAKAGHGSFALRGRSRCEEIQLRNMSHMMVSEVGLRERILVRVQSPPNKNKASTLGCKRGPV